jgi:hypothetical protein
MPPREACWVLLARLRKKPMAACRSPDPPLPAVDVRGRDFFAICDAVDRALRHFPHFVVLRGLPAGPDHRAIDALMRALEALPPDGKLDFDFVRVRPDQSENSETGTRFSRTHLALPPHTDSTAIENPHSVVAFQMVHSDQHGGGQSMVVLVQEVLEHLDDETLGLLRTARFPFGKDVSFPILWSSFGSPSIRYYRAQVDWAMTARGAAIEPIAPICEALDKVLAELAPRRLFSVGDGEVLLLNNHKVLHGRTGMPANSDRLMYRFRGHLAKLPAQ